MSEWADVPMFPGYQVSKDGRVKSLKRGVILRPFQDRQGYNHVNLWRDGRVKHFLVHRLVVAAFRGPIPPCQHVNHRNGVKGDDRLDNLEVVTPQENHRHAQEHGLAPILKGEKNYHAKLVPEQVREIRRLRKEGTPVMKLAVRFGISERAIQKVVSGETWSHIE